MKNPEETPFYNKTHRQTDTGGNVEQRLSYDAWGSLRDPATWSGCFTGTPLFDRGFTGHEHLTAFGLINMKFTLSERSAKLCLSTAEQCELGGANGRMYDPVMSSFLSVDRFLQDPTSAQGFNRYAYCGHNPLRYVDPTGWLSGIPKTKSGLIQDYLSDPCYITRQQLKEAGMYNIEGGYGWAGGQGSMSAGWMEGDGMVHTSEWGITTSGGGIEVGAWAIPSSFYSMWVNDCQGLCSYGYSNYDNTDYNINVNVGHTSDSGRGGGNWGGKTKQYHVNKIGYLPLDVNNARGYAASQIANYKMLYNVSIRNIIDNKTKTIKENQLYLKVRGSSSNTLVIGSVEASAKAFLFVEETLIDSKPFTIDPYETILNPINTSYIGSASFVIPTTGNIILKIQGGWIVNSGSGWMTPTNTIFGPPINANVTIQIDSSNP